MTITGELKNKIDAVWDDFWSGGISNPIEVLEQLTFLLFIKGLDEQERRAENKASRTGEAIDSRIYPEGDSATGVPYQSLRWSSFTDMGSAKAMFDHVEQHVFPHLEEMAEGSSHATHMAGAKLTVQSAGLLQKVVDGLDAVPMGDADTKGDVYEYMLGKLSTAKVAGQFRTPRHIIELMVHMMAPGPTDVICDPASGTCGFLVAASEYLREAHAEVLTDPASLERFNTSMFNGFDFDTTMLRIGSMNMQMHGVASPNIVHRDSLSEGAPKDEERYSLILANPPFAGSLDYDGVAQDLLAVAKTKKTELLFVSLFLRLLRPGGRAAVIVPDGVLFGSTKAHKELRRLLVEDQKLDGIVSLPSGVFKPYAGVSTAILLFTKTNSGGTDDVWFYDLVADGFSLDDKRAPLLDDELIGAVATLDQAQHELNNLPDALTRFASLALDPDSERKRARTDQSFCVPKAEIADNDYDLSINRYKEIVYEQIDYPAPSEIIAELETLEADITQGLADLKAMLS